MKNAQENRSVDASVQLLLFYGIMRKYQVITRLAFGMLLGIGLIAVLQQPSFFASKSLTGQTTDTEEGVTTQSCVIDISQDLGLSVERLRLTIQGNLACNIQEFGKDAPGYCCVKNTIADWNDVKANPTIEEAIKFYYKWEVRKNDCSKTGGTPFSIVKNSSGIIGHKGNCIDVFNELLFDDPPQYVKDLGLQEGEWGYLDDETILSPNTNETEWKNELCPSDVSCEDCQYVCEDFSNSSASSYSSSSNSSSSAPTGYCCGRLKEVDYFHEEQYLCQEEVTQQECENPEQYNGSWHDNEFLCSEACYSSASSSSSHSSSSASGNKYCCIQSTESQDIYQCEEVDESRLPSNDAYGYCTDDLEGNLFDTEDACDKAISRKCDFNSSSSSSWSSSDSSSSSQRQYVIVATVSATRPAYCCNPIQGKLCDQITPSDTCGTKNHPGKLYFEDEKNQCDASCTCGDGILQEDKGEQCDNGQAQFKYRDKFFEGVIQPASDKQEPHISGKVRYFNIPKEIAEYTPVKENEEAAYYGGSWGKQMQYSGCLESCQLAACKKNEEEKTDRNMRLCFAEYIDGNGKQVCDIDVTWTGENCTAEDGKCAAWQPKNAGYMKDIIRGPVPFGINVEIQQAQDNLQCTFLPGRNVTGGYEDTIRFLPPPDTQTIPISS